MIVFEPLALGFTLGKVPSVKPKAKGSKTITYSVPYAADKAALVAVGLSFDAKKGAVTGTKGKTLPTSYDTTGNGDYASKPLDITFRAKNGVGYADIKAVISITGAKPKFANKTASFAANAATATKVVLKQKAGSAEAKADSAGVFMTFVPATDDDATTLSDKGLAIVNWDKVVAPLVTLVSADSTDVVSVEVTVPAGATLGTWSETVEGGETPDYTQGYFTSDDKYFVYVSGTLEKGTGTDTENGQNGVAETDYLVKNEEGNEVKVYTATVTGTGDNLKVTIDTVKASYDKEVTNYVVSPDASLKNQLIIQVVDPSKVVSSKNDGAKDEKIKVNISADNLGAKVKGAVTITIKAGSSSSSSSKSAAAEVSYFTTGFGANNGRNGSAGKSAHGTAGANGDYADGEDADDNAANDGTLTVGAARTVADLSAEQQAFLAENGYKVIAVLPEVTADKADQYNLDVADLDEDAPEGETLIWLAFPKNAAPSEDDEIVDFYDEAGAPVEGVPASHKVIASPWLRENVTYEPVIAINAD